jgi:hypothetical protein
VFWFFLEFIHLLASEANEICEKTTKKTIAAEHILAALKNLGFEHYSEDVQQEHGLHRQEQKVRAAILRYHYLKISIATKCFIIHLILSLKDIYVTIKFIMI